MPTPRITSRPLAKTGPRPGASVRRAPLATGDPYARGAAAWQAGKSLAENPHFDGDARETWAMGWADADEIERRAAIRDNWYQRRGV